MLGFFKKKKTVSGHREPPSSVDRGILVFDNTSEVIQAENLLKKNGWKVRVMGPPPEIQTGCDLVIVFPLIEQLEIVRLLTSSNNNPLQVVPVTDPLLEPVSLFQVKDFGAYLMVRVLIEMARLKREGKDFIGLLRDLSEPCESEEFRIAIAGDDFKEYGKEALARLNEAAKSHGDWEPAADNHEGVRFAKGDGWFMMRLSLHDPVLPVNMESDTAGGVREMARELYGVLKDMDRLDLGSLERYIEKQ